MLTDLTAEHIRQMPAGTETDRMVSEAIGVEPEVIWIATNDHGQSACASTDRREGPWYTKQELESWLRVQHSRGLHLGYELATWQKYRPYSTDPTAAKQATDAMVERTGWDWSLHVRTGKFQFTWYTPLAHARHIHVDAAPTEELARCRAVLLAAKEKPR